MRPTTRTNLAVNLAVLFILVYVFAVGCATATPAPTATVEVDPNAPVAVPYEAGAPVSAKLVVGEEVTGAETAMFATAATDECSDRPEIIDSRPEGHSSLAVLPRLAPGDYDKAQAFYKFQLSDQYGCQRAKSGEKYWDIKALFFECGASNIQPQVYDIDGNKITDVGILLFNNWPGTEQFPYAVDPPYFSSGVAGFTSNGDIGWAYGGESHIGADGGPYNVWASSDPTTWTDRRVGSDAMLKIGWWDDHCEFSPIFQTVRKAGTVTPPGDGYELVDTDENGNETGRIPFKSGDAPGGSRNLKLQLDGADLGYVPWQ